MSKKELTVDEILDKVHIEGFAYALVPSKKNFPHPVIKRAKSDLYKLLEKKVNNMDIADDCIGAVVRDRSRILSMLKEILK